MYMCVCICNVYILKSDRGNENLDNCVLLHFSNSFIVAREGKVDPTTGHVGPEWGV
jgi:hypothetical protein